MAIKSFKGCMLYRPAILLELLILVSLHNRYTGRQMATFNPKAINTHRHKSTLMSPSLTWLKKKLAIRDRCSYSKLRFNSRLITRPKVLLNLFRLRRSKLLKFLAIRLFSNRLALKLPKWMGCRLKVSNSSKWFTLKTCKEFNSSRPRWSSTSYKISLNNSSMQLFNTQRHQYPSKLHNRFTKILHLRRQLCTISSNSISNSNKCMEGSLLSKCTSRVLLRVTL